MTNVKPSVYHVTTPLAFYRQLSVFSPYRVVSPTSHISNHNVGYRNDLTIFGLLDEDGNTTRDELTVKLDALCTSYEPPITVVACNDTFNKLFQLDPLILISYISAANHHITVSFQTKNPKFKTAFPLPNLVFYLVLKV